VHRCYISIFIITFLVSLSLLLLHRHTQPPPALSLFLFSFYLLFNTHRNLPLHTRSHCLKASVAHLWFIFSSPKSRSKKANPLSCIQLLLSLLLLFVLGSGMNTGKKSELLVQTNWRPNIMASCPSPPAKVLSLISLHHHLPRVTVSNVLWFWE
jgi:hypothetical protein